MSNWSCNGIPVPDEMALQLVRGQLLFRLKRRALALQGMCWCFGPADPDIDCDTCPENPDNQRR